MTQQIYVVRVMLRNPQQPNEGMNFLWLFDQQPTEEDVLSAYAFDPVSSKHADHKVYGSVLTQCLNTFGVPKLSGYQSMIDGTTKLRVAVPMVKANWVINAMSEDSLITDIQVGYIVVSIRSVISLKPQEPAASPVVKPNRKAAK